MVKGKCCICGTVKDCAPYLDKVLNNIDKISAIFDDYIIIFAYDKSSDNSLDILEKYRILNKKVIIDVNLDPLYNFREYNIAKARNKCLDIIRSQFVSYDYFIMIDCDDVSISPVNLDPLQYYLEDKQLSDWDALTFNKEIYYDLWALSKYPYSFSCFHFQDYKAWGRFIEKVLYVAPPKKLISCFSAFNGFGIYKTNIFINGFYDPSVRLDLLPKHLLEATEKIAGPIFLRGKAGVIDCEHRSFHFMAINKHNARIRIAPEIIFSNKI